MVDEISYCQEYILKMLESQTLASLFYPQKTFRPKLLGIFHSEGSEYCSNLHHWIMESASFHCFSHHRFRSVCLHVRIYDPKIPHFTNVQTLHVIFGGIFLKYSFIIGYEMITTKPICIHEIIVHQAKIGIQLHCFKHQCQ